MNDLGFEKVRAMRCAPFIGPVVLGAGNRPAALKEIKQDTSVDPEQ